MAAISFLASAVPANFQNEILITGLSEPTGIAFTPNQRMFIIQRGGRVWVVQPGATQVDPTPLLDITNINTLDGERGLVGIAIDPSFSTNGFYYLFYTANSPLRDRVSRFTASGNTTVPGSELVIWQDNVTAPSFHHGGGLAFGPDGFLYISTGDHTLSSTAQSLTSYNGKMLRIASNGSIPTNNPFYDGAGPNLDEIWARGLRNPFRFSFDSATGRMIIGDNGDNDPASSIEEVNVGAAGANYGWPVCQGTCGTAGMTNPIHQYPHSGRDASMIGGFSYRGSQFPAEYQGTYFFADYVQNWIRRLAFDSNGNVTGVVNFEPTNGASDGPYGDIVNMVQGPDDSMYYVDIGLSWEGTEGTASIRRIRYTATNQPPIAQAAANPTQGLAPLTVNFSSAGSSDPENQPLSYTWTFGDLTTSTQANPSKVYSNTGTYVARLTVSDGTTTTLSNPITITVGTPPTVTIQSPLNNATFRAGDTIVFSGSATDSGGSAIPPSGLSWNVQFLHDNHTHPFLGPVSNITGGDFFIPLTGHDYRGLTRYLVALTATDSLGLKNTASVLIFPQKVNLTMETSPVDLNLIFDGITETAPFVWDTLIGFEHVIEAPNQAVGNTSYNLSSWSDGGAQTHTITVPAQNRTYTANYQISPQPAGLMAAYSFREGSGGTTEDASLNNRMGNLTNATWTPSGRYGNGLVFNGTTSRVTAPSMMLPSTFTIMAWINNPSAQNYETILSVGQHRDIYLQNGVLVLESPVPGTTRSFGAALPTNSWHHIALTSNGTSTAAYLDGNSLGTIQSAITDSFTGALQVGAWTNGSTTADYFSGSIDEVRVFSVALTQSQIQAAMNTPILAASTYAAEGLRNQLVALDSNESNGLSLAEAQAQIPGLTATIFNQIDTNLNGELSMSELLNASVGPVGVQTPVYVDFLSQGSELGTFANPFNTLAEGAAFVAPGGNVVIMTGDSPERPLLAAPMTLQAQGGAVVIGAP